MDRLIEGDSWKAIESTGVHLALSRVSTPHGAAMVMEYDYRNRGGFVLAERKFAKRLGEDFEFSFWVRADSPRNNFEFKLMDASGENVWWVNRIAYAWPTEWTHVVLRRRHFQFAWGPKPGPLTEIGSLQIGIAANAGGSGKVWIADLTYRETPAAAPFSPKYTVHSQSEHQATLDLGAVREIGGLVSRWTQPVETVSVKTSSDLRTWSEARTFDIRQTNGLLSLPETQARYLRLEAGPEGTFRSAEILPVEATDTANHLLGTIGRISPRGDWPRTLRGEQAFWTVVGSRSGNKEFLINQDGMVELGQGLPSIEPSLDFDGTTLGWAGDVQASCQLQDGHLPLPQVSWTKPLGLTITPLSCSTGQSEEGAVRYRVSNPTKKAVRATLKLRFLPLQVNAPWQFLNREGGYAAIDAIQYGQEQVWINKLPVATSRPFQALPAHPIAAGTPGMLSGTILFDLDLKAGAQEDIVLSWPLAGKAEAWSGEDFETAYRKETRDWKRALDVVAIRLPDEGARWAQVALANLGYVLVNRDGPAIQPGSRSYERTWIRDGSMTSAALLRFGRFDEVKELIQWYGKHIGEDGWVPCVVDRRGADPVPEHDSHGQFLYLVAEYLRFTDDEATVREQFTTVRRVVANIDRLRSSTRDDAGRANHWFGMMPESISHEGYSAKPMHSYWDNFWTAKGLEDAVFLARELGQETDAKAWTALAQEFRTDLKSSIEAAAKAKGVDYLPGCAELGDFDATSSAIAVSPCELENLLNPGQVKATFDRYWKFFEDRRRGRIEWVDYTPYEIRNVNAFLMRGEAERARQLMAWFLRDSYPNGWNHWAEIVHRNPQQGKWIGDMPHTWVGSEWIKAFRNLIVYEDESGARGLVVAAGIPERWVRAPGGLSVANLPVAGGRLALQASIEEGELVYTVDVKGAATGTPVHLVLPRGAAHAQIKVNGTPVRQVSDRVRMETFPARVTVRYGTDGQTMVR